MQLHNIRYILLFLLLAGCTKKYLDINTDPNNPVAVESSKLLPTVEKNIADAMAIGSGTVGGFSDILSVYMHQVTTLEDPDKYGSTGNNFYLALAWPGLYQNALANIEKIIQSSQENDEALYSGVAKVLKAYTYSQLVDIFGNVPFSEAIQLTSGITYPKFDSGATIYPKLFSLLDSAITDLSNTAAANKHVPGSDDIIYGGNTILWIKAANTLKLKLYTQIRLVQDVKSEVSALVAQNNLINSTGEGFMFKYGPFGATDDRNPGFGDYYAGQRTHYMSPWFYEILKGYNPNIFTGIRDPRMPYYFYNQLGKTQPPREGNQTEYRDSAFVSVYFGSVGVNKSFNQQNSMTVFGIYPVGGRYDEGDAQAVSSNSGTGAAPYRFITYADRLYLEAELIHAGLLSGVERDMLKQAMEESFKQVDYVVSLTGTSQNVPLLAGTAATENYINAVLARFDAASGDKKLEIIMTEKWISSFGCSVDQYTDYRRTGYPILFDPNNPAMAPGGFVQPPVNGDPIAGAGNQPAVPVQLSLRYPQSLPWYTAELESNPNAPPQKQDLSAYKVFWKP